MTLKLTSTFVAIITVWCINSVICASYVDVSAFSASYYDLMTKTGLEAELEDSERDPSLPTRIAFRGIPCKCENLTCGCCAGINMTAIQIDRRACTTFTYVPEQLAFKLAVTMNEREIYKTSISAKNPPPMCVPFPYMPAVNFCVRFFDMSTAGNNLHACIDFETRFVTSPVLVMHFDCVIVGVDGFTWTKPGQTNVTLPLEDPKPAANETEVFDEVTFEPASPAQYVSTSTLSPEEEAQIGQLKI